MRKLKRVRPHVWDRILAHRTVDPTTGCWVWTGRPNKWGYGQVSYRGKMKLLHRVVYHLVHGWDLSSPERILHHCDNPPCFRPSHLFRGSQRDNIRDMWAKGRDNHAHGERGSAAKLTAKMVIELRRRYARGESQTALAREAGVSQVAVSKAVRGETWAHLPF